MSKEYGTYIKLPEEVNRKLDMIASILPAKPDGTKYHKKDVVAKAVQEYLSRFDEVFEGTGSLSEIIDRAKTIDLDILRVDLSE